MKTKLILNDNTLHSVSLQELPTALTTHSAHVSLRAASAFILLYDVDEAPAVPDLTLMIKRIQRTFGADFVKVPVTLVGQTKVCDSCERRRILTLTFRPTSMQPSRPVCRHFCRITLPSPIGSAARCESLSTGSFKTYILSHCNLDRSLSMQTTPASRGPFLFVLEQLHEIRYHQGLVDSASPSSTSAFSGFRRSTRRLRRSSKKSARTSR